MLNFGAVPSLVLLVTSTRKYPLIVCVVCIYAKSHQPPRVVFIVFLGISIGNGLAVGAWPPRTIERARLVILYGLNVVSDAVQASLPKNTVCAGFAKLLYGRAMLAIAPLQTASEYSCSHLQIAVDSSGFLGL